MRKLRIILAAALAVATAVVAASAFAGASKAPVPFKASFAGKAVVRVTGDLADISATAAGTGVPIGKSTLAGKGSGSKSDPCPLFGGLSTISAKTGKLKFTVPAASGKACTDEEGQQFTLSGRATIAGGTGAYAKAKGSFKFAGSYDRKTGAFSVKFVGTLTV